MFNLYMTEEYSFVIKLISGIYFDASVKNT